MAFRVLVVRKRYQLFAAYGPDSNKYVFI